VKDKVERNLCDGMGTIGIHSLHNYLIEEERQRGKSFKINMLINVGFLCSTKLLKYCAVVWSTNFSTGNYFTAVLHVVFCCVVWFL
jgi:hypothetical protein